jgi:uncharacterized protein with HEPN domain
MARKIGHLLHDILEAIEHIEHATCGKTLPEFEASWETRWLVQRGIEIISEASRGIPDAAKSLRPEIPWKKIAASEMCCVMIIRGLPTISSGASSMMNFPNSRPRSKQFLQP